MKLLFFAKFITAIICFSLKFFNRIKVCGFPHPYIGGPRWRLPSFYFYILPLQIGAGANARVREVISFQ